MTNKFKIFFLLLFIMTTSFNKLYSQELDIDPLYRIQLLIQMQEYNSAIDFTKALNDSLKCQKNEILGFTYGKMEKYDLAIKHYENYIEQCNPSSIQRINLGDNYFKTRQFLKAKEQFQIVDKTDINYPLAQYNLGMIEYESNNKTEAVKHFVSSISNSKNGTLDFLYVDMLIKTLTELKDYDKAFKNIDVVLSFWNENSDEYKYALILKASIYGAKGEYKKAISELDNIINTGIDNEIVLIEAYSYQLDYYFKLKNQNKACDIYQKLLELKPDIEILKEYKCK